MTYDELLTMDGFTRRERQLIRAGVCDADEVEVARECNDPSHFLDWLKEQRHAA